MKAQEKDSVPATVPETLVPPIPAASPAMPVAPVAPTAIPIPPATPTMPVAPVASAAIPTSPVAPVMPSVPEMTEAEIEAGLETARKEYVSQLVGWKNKTRENKYKFNTLIQNLYKTADNTREQLGFKRKMPPLPKSEEFQIAERAYQELKKKRATSIMASFLRKNSETVGEKVGTFSEDLLESVKKERDLIQKLMAESVPPLEKGIITKGIEKWAKIPLAKRVLITSALMTAIFLPFGTVAVGAVAGAGAYRVARSFAGASVGVGVGKIADKIMQKGSADRTKEALEKYALEMGVDMGNYEEREKELAEFFEKEENQVKRNRLKKAAAVVVAGGVANAGASMLAGSALGYVPGAGFRPAGLSNESVGWKGSPNVEEVHAPRGSVIPPAPAGEAMENVDSIRPLQGAMANEPNVSGSPSHLVGQDSGKFSYSPDPTNASTGKFSYSPDKLNSTPGGPGALETPSLSKVIPVEVDSSPKGLEQDLLDLRAKLKAQYGGDMSKMPEDVRKIVETPYRELSTKGGFFDPETGESGRSMQGAKLVYDENGLSYKYNGQTNVILESKSGAFHKFGEFKGNEMFTPDQPKPTLGQEAVIDKGVVIGPTPPEVVPAGQSLGPGGVQMEGLDLDRHGLSTVKIEGTNPEIFGNDKNLFPPGPLENSPTRIPFKGTFIDVLDKGGVKTLEIEGLTVAQEQPFGNGKLMVLDDKFQDGPQNMEVREAFSKLVDLDKYDGDYLPGKSVPFEGGNVTVFFGSGENRSSMEILLNGKKIAHGVVGDGKIDIKYDPSLPKSGWLFKDNVYERAFNEAKKLVKTIEVKR